MATRDKLFITGLVTVGSLVIWHIMGASHAPTVGEIQADGEAWDHRVQAENAKHFATWDKIDPPKHK